MQKSITTSKLSELSKSDMSSIFKSGNKKNITDLLLYITFNIDDFEWVQEQCIKMIASKDEDISGLAITCIGHIARIYSKISANSLVALRKKRNDTQLGGRVQDALDDIETFTAHKE